MKAFLVGLIYLFAIAIFVGLGLLLYPLLLLTGLLLRLIFGLMLIIFFIWFLGKIIIFIFEKLK